MARRVNTKFVVILSTALLGTGGVFVGVRLYRSWQRSNPEYVNAQAKAAEDKGDLKSAADLYGTEADLMSRRHISGADAVYVHAAELSMKVSRTAQTQQDAVEYYQKAMRRYNAALAENPLNKAVNETLLEEDYQDALQSPGPTAWKEVEKKASALIRNQDGVKPRLYRAEALLAQTSQAMDMTAVMKNITDIYKNISNIDGDLKAALKFDPPSGKARALQARLIWYQGNVDAVRRGLTQRDEFNSDSAFQLSAWQARQTLVCYLENRPWPREAGAAWLWPCTAGWSCLGRLAGTNVDSDAASTLALLTMDQLQMASQLNRQRLGGITQLISAALNSASRRAAAGGIGGDSALKNGLADQLGTIYLQTGQPDLTEALYKQMVKDGPEAPENYFRLAGFYRDTGRLADAIATFEEVTRHTQIGGGREAQINQALESTAWTEIAWLNLELASRSGISAGDLNGYMKEAADAIDKMRASNLGRGLIDLMEGRSQLIRHDRAHAEMTLKSAEANLRGADGQYARAKFRATELLLAQVYREENQLGAALDMLDKALEVQPGDVAVLLQKGWLLEQVGRMEEAQILAGKILGETNPGEFTRKDSLPKDVADAALQIWSIAEARGPHKNVQVLAGDPLHTAQMQLDAGDYDAALVDATTVLSNASASDAQKMAAYQIAISCNLQLKDRKEEAKKLVAEALARYPQSTAFQVYKAMLDQPGDFNSVQVQEAAYKTITDPFDRAWNLANLYQGQAKPALDRYSSGLALAPAEVAATLAALDKEIKTLQESREVFRSGGPSSDPDKFNSLLDRQFSADLMASDILDDEAKRAAYWKDAQVTIVELEKLNLDGTDGKLYQGQLDLAQSNGQKGMQLLQQAVAQRPDYAPCHMVLALAYLARAHIEQSKQSSAAAADLSAALDQFRAVVRLAPNNISALQNAIALLVNKGDSSSLKEAQTLLEAGLAQAPHNSVLIGFTEIFAEKVDDSIAMRESIYKQQPQDRNNVHRLAALYVRKKDKEVDPDKKLNAMNRAIALIRTDYESHKDAPDALFNADLLARYLVAYVAPPKVAAGADVATIRQAELDAEKAAADAANSAIDLYAPYVSSEKPELKFAALIAKAEFFRSLTLPAGSLRQLMDAKVIAHADPRDEAADMLQEAIKIEPAGLDDAERHLADMYFELGRFADAEKIYDQVLKNNRRPDDMDRVNRRVIEAELRQAKYADAEPRLNALLKTNGKDIQGLILRAYASVQHGMASSESERPQWLKAAQTDLAQVLALDPGNADAFYYRAIAELSLGEQMDDAERDFIEASKHDKTGVNSRIQLAELYVRTQRYEEAAQEYSEILKLHPEMLPIRTEYSDLLLSLAQLQTTLPLDSDVEFIKALRRLDPLERLDQAISDAEQLYPNQLRWPMIHAQSLELQGKNAEALRWYKSLYDMLHEQHALDADLCDAYLGALLKNKENDKVVELATSLITTYTDFINKNPQYVSFYLKRAAAYQAMGNHTQEAIADIDQAFAVGVKAVNESNNVAPYIAVLGEVASDDSTADPESHPLDGALVADRLRERLKANPSETISQIGLVQTLMSMHDYAGALQVVDTMKAPADNSILRFLVLRESGLVHAEAKQYAQADKDYQALAKMAPDNIEVLNNYAFMLTEAGRVKEAITYGEKALKFLSVRSDPNRLALGPANVYDTLGWAYFLNNELPKAEEYLKKSVSVQPHAMAYLHLALTQEKMGGSWLRNSAPLSCAAGIKLATTRRDVQTLKALYELQVRIDQANAPQTLKVLQDLQAKTESGREQPALDAARP